MTNDDKALVAELRINDKEIYLPVLGKSADRIEALSEENERLREVLGDLIEAVQRRTADLGGYDGRFGLNKSIVKARAVLAARDLKIADAEMQEELR